MKKWAWIIGVIVLIIVAPHSLAQLATALVNGITVFVSSLNLH
jgi:Sec-independent protein translocase protein TatA